MPGATDRQLGAIVRVLTEHGVRTREHRLAIIRALAGRPLLESSKELSGAQARSILRHFDDLREIGELVALVEQWRPEVAR